MIISLPLQQTTYYCLKQYNFIEKYYQLFKVNRCLQYLKTDYSQHKVIYEQQNNQGTIRKIFLVKLGLSMKTAMDLKQYIGYVKY